MLLTTCISNKMKYAGDKTDWVTVPHNSIPPFRSSFEKKNNNLINNKVTKQRVIKAFEGLSEELTRCA